MEIILKNKVVLNLLHMYYLNLISTLYYSLCLRENKKQIAQYVCVW